MSRRFTAALALALGLALTGGTTAHAAPARGAGTVAITGPDAVAEVGTAVAATVEVTGATDPVTVTLRAVDGDGDTVGRLVGTAVVTPPATNATLAIPTSTVGSRWYYVAAVDATDQQLLGDDWRQVTVVGHPTAVTATLPTATVRAGAARSITGTVTVTDDGAPASAAGRTVQVQARGGNGTWVPLAETRVAADGTFSVRAPTWWVARQTLRAYVTGDADDAAAATTDVGTMTVRRTYRPRGGTAHTFLGSSRARWNPCAPPIAWRLTPGRHLPRGALADLRWAFARVSEATGLRFSYAGRSTYVPWTGGRRAFPSNADFVVAFTNPHVVPGLAGSVIGLGGSSWNSTARFDGGVSIDADQPLGPISRAAKHNVMLVLYLHEIGHAIGLDHVADRRQIMAQGSFPKAEYAAGDLAGLAALGASKGCTTATAQRAAARSTPVVGVAD